MYLPVKSANFKGEEISFNAVIYVVSFHANLRFSYMFVSFYGLLFVFLSLQKYTIFQRCEELAVFF